MPVAMSASKVFRVLFYQQNELFEVYVRDVFQSDVLGFVTLETFLFGNRTRVLVDPAEDRLRTMFDGVKSTLVPVSAVVRIDEVTREGQSKIVPLKGEKVTPFPSGKPGRP